MKRPFRFLSKLNLSSKEAFQVEIYEVGKLILSLLSSSLSGLLGSTGDMSLIRGNIIHFRPSFFRGMINAEGH